MLISNFQDTMNRFIQNIGDIKIYAIEEKSKVNSAPYKIENAAWYGTWYACDIDNIPENVNTIYLTIGKLDIVSGKCVVNGLQGFFQQGQSQVDQVKQFVNKCGKDINVKLTIGDGTNDPKNPGYQDCWDLITNENISDFAQALVDFCHTTGLSGIDFDWEPVVKILEDPKKLEAQGNIVGQLIGEFKSKGKNLEASLCTFVGWQQPAYYVFNTANKAIDRINVMAYVDYNNPETKDVFQWVQHWMAWSKENYDFSPQQVTFGMAQQFQSDIPIYAKWSQEQGLSTNLWLWDPASVDFSNEMTATIWDVYHPKTFIHQQFENVVDDMTVLYERLIIAKRV